MKEAVPLPEYVQTPTAVINSLNASYSEKYHIRTKTDDVACPTPEMSKIPCLLINVRQENLA